MLILPYRAKNPPDRFPFITVGLIVTNVVVYGLTSDGFSHVTKEALQAYAVTHNNLSVLRLLTAMFLHMDPFHLIGNMLFLWLFGASVEGRLGYLKFLPLYLICGMTGGLLSDLVLGLAAPDMPSLGASGAIMGLAGAYLYLFPYSTICVFWWFRFRIGIVECQALWVIIAYGVFDLLFAMLFRGADGVGHFAHLGGLGAGFLAVMVLRAPRDSRQVSEAQATRAEIRGADYSMLGYYDLEALLEHPNPDISLLMAYFEAARQHTGGGMLQPSFNALQKHQRMLLEGLDPVNLAEIALWIPPSVGSLPTSFYMVLAPRVAGAGSPELAMKIYRRVYDIDPSSRDSEMALYRMAGLAEAHSTDRSHAAAAYNELLRLFPNGEMSLDARNALRRLGLAVR